jgi:3-methyladenine DNA glycosylase AlkD
MTPVTRNRQKSDDVLRWLERRGTRRNIEGMARFGITSPKAFGVSIETMRPLVRRLGHDHALAAALWRTRWHEARILASLIDEPARVTAAQMEKWVRDFDNWAVCDSVCFHLFDRTPHAWKKAAQWSRQESEFVKRAAFALMAGLTVHDKHRPDPAFIRLLPIIERGARDPRNFVKKAVNWALRQIGKRNLTLNGAAIAVAGRLAAADEPAPRWIGKDALREITGPAVQQRLIDRAKRGR